MRSPIFSNISTFFVFAILFIPKITLVPIPGYWQGIRIEDILILIFFFQIIYYDRKIKIFDNKRIYNNFYYYLLILLFSEIVASFYKDVNIILTIRLFQYFILIFLFEELIIDKKNLSYYLKIYLLINLIFAILQKLKLVGSITSLGFLDTDHFLSQRSMGLTGGSWELGVIVSIIFFIFTFIKKNNYELFIVFIISLICCYLAEGRANFVALITSTFIYLVYSNKIYIYHKIIIFTIIAIILFLFNTQLYELKFINKIIGIDFNFLNKLFFATLNNIELNVDTIPNPEVHLSIWYRMKEWRMAFEIINSNNLSLLIGAGLTKIYTESVYLRILLSSGVVGILYVLIVIAKVRIYLLVFFLISGAFLDLFMSIKIFSFTLLLIYVIKDKYVKKNNIE